MSANRENAAASGAPLIASGKDALLSLADKCEQATGPDRELDELCALAVGYTLVDPRANERLPDVKRWVTPDGVRNGWVYNRERGGFPPRYTASIDAAITLVPKGLDCSLWWGVRGGKPIATAEIGGHAAIASMPALALAAAALRARSADA